MLLKLIMRTAGGKFLSPTLDSYPGPDNEEPQLFFSMFLLENERLSCISSQFEVDGIRSNSD